MANPTEWQVLVVEDEYDSIQMVSKILRHHGVDVHIAHDGHECLAFLHEHTPTLIIMDLALPEMDGWETLVKIRGDEKIAHIPIAAITAYHSVNVEEDAHDAGFDAYFPKPLNPNTIVEHLSELLDE